MVFAVPSFVTNKFFILPPRLASMSRVFGKKHRAVFILERQNDATKELFAMVFVGNINEFLFWK